MGAGAAFFDYDGDDRPDLYLVNGAPLPGGAPGRPTGALYRNLGGGRFRDVTREAGLADTFYGMGAAVGDVDADGRLDLFVTGVGGDRLYRNLGGRFEEVAARWGLTDGGFGSSAAFLDYDGDGRLDLFVGRYVDWAAERDVECNPTGRQRIYCTPEIYDGQSNRLYRNVDGRRFEDMTRAAGVFQPEGKTLGVVPLDADLDGWPDLAVANDTVRNFLFVNQKDGTFEERGIEAGLAFSESGATRGGMGIDAGDLTGRGLPDVVVGNFSQEMSAVYRAAAGGLWTDDAAQVGIGLPTLMTLAFGTLVFDADNDGWLDVLFANGHIEPEIAKSQRLQTYAQPLQLFRNAGGGERFDLVTDPPGSALATPWVGRGLAAADVDGDGDLDLALTQNGREARLLRNDSPPRAWIRLRLVGQKSNRTGYGATVRAVAGGTTIVRGLVSGRSYLSASEPVLTIGLGDRRRLDRLEITWPSGTVQTIASPALNRLHVVTER